VPKARAFKVAGAARANAAPACSTHAGLAAYIRGSLHPQALLRRLVRISNAFQPLEVPPAVKRTNGHPLVS
jgi:hypothetical protein